MKKILVLICLTFLTVSAAVASWVDLLAEGRLFLEAKDLPNAYARFNSVLVIMPDNRAANLLAATTRIALLTQNPDTKVFLDRLGVSPNGRNIYQWTADFKRDDAGQIMLPTSLKTSQGVSYLRNRVLPTLDASLVNLSRITNASYTFTFTAAETGTESITLDYGDIRMLRALSHALKFHIYTINGNNFDVRVGQLLDLYGSDQLTLQSFLSAYPDILKTMDANDIRRSRVELNSAIDEYVAASSFIRARKKGVNRLFELASTDLDREEQFRTFLQRIQQALSSPQQFGEEQIYLAPYFSGTNNLQKVLPRFQGNNYVWWSLPDYTFGHVLSNRSQYEVNALISQKITTVYREDLVRPTIAVTNVTGQPTISSLFAIRGTAYDNVQVARVEWQVNGGAFSSAPINGNGWSVTPSLTKGTNVVRLRSVDSSENESALVVRTFVFTPIMPTITTQPVSRSVAAGTNAVMSVSASGTKPLSFQWLKGTNILAGQTNSALMLPYVTKSDAGIYRAKVSNAAGSVFSSNATLSVNCSFSVTPGIVSLTHTGGTADISITTVGGCSWTVANTPSWITVTASGTFSGDGVVSLTIAENPSPNPRTGTINIAGTSVRVWQEGYYAPVTLYGKTIRFDIESGDGTLTNGDAIVLASYFKTNLCRVLFSPTNFALTAQTYTYSATAPSGAAFTVVARGGEFAASLTFTSPTRGTFTSTYDGAAQSGHFSITANRADSNNDYQGDLLLQSTNNTLRALLLNGTKVLANVSMAGNRTLPAGSKVVGTADFDGNGTSDLLIQNSNSSFTLWRLNRTNFLSAVQLRSGFAPGVAWQGVSAGDFNNDGKPDVMLRNTDGRMSVWFFNNTNYLANSGFTLPSAVATARVAGATDFDGDNQLDLVFQKSSGAICVGVLKGATYLETLSLVDAIPLSQKAVAFGDFDRDGRVDILLQDSTSAISVYYPHASSGKFGYLSLAKLNSGWKVAGPR